MTESPTEHTPLVITGLRKTYRRVSLTDRSQREALVNVNLRVEAGEIHGFLGPNGAGKTTTLRVVTGLAAKDEGHVSIFDKEVPNELGEAAALFGALLETPRLPGYLTPLQHLSLLAGVAGVPRTRCVEVLELVDLTARAKDPIRHLSLGMKQRIGLATALLRSPRLLLLDEPMNGLDPAGVRDMRNLLRHVASNGVAVLLSSHLLREVEELCDRVTVLHRGTSVASGTVAEVARLSGAGQVVVTTRPDQSAPATRTLRDAGFTVDRRGDVLHLSDVEDAGRIGQVLAGEGIYPLRLQETDRLEDVFLALTEVDNQ